MDCSMLEAFSGLLVTDSSLQHFSVSESFGILWEMCVSNTNVSSLSFVDLSITVICT